MSTDSDVPSSTKSDRLRIEGEAFRPELTALALVKVEDHKGSQAAQIPIRAYKVIIKEIIEDLKKVGIEVDAPPLLRKSATLSVSHDAMAGTLLLEMVRCKQQLGVYHREQDPGQGENSQQPQNKAQTEAEDRLYRRLFALMDQLRKNDKAFFDHIALIEPMGVSRPAHPNKKKGPPSPSGSAISVTDGGDANLDDAAVLREIKAAALRQLAFVKRMEKFQAIEGESEVLG